MLLNLTAVLAACSLVSCVTLVRADDTKGSGSGNGFPLSQADGSGGSNGSNGPNGGSGDGSGPSSYGLDGDRWQDRVPRLPMWYIATSGGVYNSSVHPEDNYRGYVNWWRGENAVEELITRIGRGYEVGARWFFINRPMGAPSNTHVPGASWLTMSADKREKIPALLTDALLDQFDEPVHVVWFVGSDMTDARDYPGWNAGNEDAFFGVGEDANWTQVVSSRVTLGGWISTGASGIAFDHSGPIGERDHYIRLFEQLSGFPFHLAIYGEAFPLKNENGRVARGASGSPLFDEDAINSMPWIAIDRFIDGRWPIHGSSESFPLDADMTRMFVWFNKAGRHYGSENQRSYLVNSYMDQNLIPITNDPVMFQEAMNRLSPSYSSTGGGGSGGQAGNSNGQSGGGSGSGTSSQSASASGGGGGGSSSGSSGGGSSGSGIQTMSGQGSKSGLPQRYTRKGRQSN